MVLVEDFLVEFIFNLANSFYVGERGFLEVDVDEFLVFHRDTIFNDK